MFCRSHSVAKLWLDRVVSDLPTSQTGPPSASSRSALFKYSALAMVTSSVLLSDSYCDDTRLLALSALQKLAVCSQSLVSEIEWQGTVLLLLFFKLSFH